ncbi:hypothetical protein MMC26_005391 [Xylographa opegraphella]|nr:hypothetical protein [Xylographa opegraphella]
MDPASSVAGLIGLAGLLLKSVSFLYSFCSSVKHVSEEVSSLVGSIENLQALLRYIEDLLRQDAVRALQSTWSTAAWDERVKECEKDLGAWLQVMQLFQAGDAKSFKKYVRNMKAAADEGKFRKMRLRLDAHHQHLSLHLNILNGNIGLKNTQMLVANRAAADRSDTSQGEAQRSLAYSLKSIAESTKINQTLGETSIDYIQSGLKEFGAQASTNQSDTIAYLERIEQRCYVTQMCLLRSVKKSKRATRWPSVPKMPPKSRIIDQVPRPNINELLRQRPDTSNENVEIHHLVQVVKPAILMYESSGSILRALLPLEDSVYTSVGLREKIALVQQLQNMRLVIWLLRRDRVCSSVRAVPGYPSVSKLGLEGSLMFNYFRDRVGPLRIVRMLRENEEFNLTCSWLSSPRACQIECYDTSSHWMLQMARSHYILDAHPDRMCYRTAVCKNNWRVFFGHQGDKDRPEVSEEIVEVFRKLLSDDYCLEDLVVQAMANRGQV